MPRTRTVSFYADDFEDRLSALLTEVAALEKHAGGSSRRLVESPELAAKREEFNALRREAQASATVITLRALSRAQWLALKRDHPPRTEGVDDDTRKADAAYGLNVEAAEDDLVYAALVSPEFRSRAAFDEWVNDVLSAAEFGRLAQVAFELIAVAPDPKSLPALPTPSSVGTSD